MKIAVFPGSFDPITLGHQDIVSRGLPLFDKIIVAVGKNANKQYMFSLDQRLEWIQQTFSDEPKIEVDAYSGLTVNYCRDKGADFILRGLRNPADFEFEKAVAQTNRKLNHQLETVFLLTSSGLSSISSSIVRDVLRHGGDYTQFVPTAVRVP
ncbi:MAG TPA: pantetheine-phosphate adenylyltransferase [Cryomorphaceae bacterium]|nr:pantetheine-phosphate adenylyltransferase [Owenweeksia sp.]HAD96846.1 pantetheine-phosphate adenylyltransferase [Cryomorphaceae bacterium]HBF19690.1 pantetheine-phosphate adenylyltransferase [Cryomorphaceae bacterium]HCQ14970.1 pantetheine-phosphate adenylyltransferase [Cryomorphaceae bacterium]|tara:strand:+ start:228 stop:686 length:459 start_codon:yes stop_codon:yes gene_type:complete